MSGSVMAAMAGATKGAGIQPDTRSPIARPRVMDDPVVSFQVCPHRRDHAVPGDVFSVSGT